MAETLEIDKPSKDEGKVLFPISTALTVLGLLLAFALLPRLFASPKSAMVGKEAPAFTVDVVANSPAERLSLSDLKGQAVILDFWATWCGPCQVEAPVLNKISQRFKDRGLAVVGVNTSDAPGRARPWALGHGITFPIVYDDGAVASLYGVQNLPTMVLLSRDGKVLAVRTGITSDAELERLVTGAL